MPKEKSQRQVRYLLSSGSPLTDEQKAKLKRELHSGAVTIKKKKHKKFNPDKMTGRFY